MSKPIRAFMYYGFCILLLVHFTLVMKIGYKTIDIFNCVKITPGMCFSLMWDYVIYPCFWIPTIIYIVEMGKKND